MADTKISSRDYCMYPARAKNAAIDGSVFITDRGKPSHVLLSIENYEELVNQGKTIADGLDMPSADDIDFDPVISSINFKVVDLEG